MKMVEEVWGVKVMNTAPHPITFGREGSDETVSVPPCGTLINATAKEEPVALRPNSLVEFVSTKFVGNEEGTAFLRNVPGDVIVVGSIIAAQAYPEEVFALVPVKGFERVPPGEKRMRHDKFTVFEKRR